MNDLSAIVVSFNSSLDLPHCLRNVHDVGIESVYVFDNASRDESAAIAEAAGANTIRSSSNLGFGAAVNRAMSLVADPYVLLLNPDCTLSAECLGRLLEVLTTDERLAAIVPSMRYPDGSAAIAGGAEPSVVKEVLGFVRVGDIAPRSFLTWVAARGHIPIVDRLVSYARTAPGRGTISTDWVSGYCMLLRRDAFERVGGFDESFFLYFEDADLCVRFRQYGLRVAVVRDAVAVHRESTATSRVGKARLYAGGMRVYFTKHGGPFQRLAIQALATLMR